jgi:RND family efflux transporter MFP subunit
MTRLIPAIVVTGVLVLLATGGLMVRAAERRVNDVALASSPQPVTVVAAKASTYRATRTYGGVFASWVQADISPQYVSAYVDTVLVRPGAAVSKGAVLATLDCRNASATTRAVEMQARAIATQQKATANEAARMRQVASKGGYISQNDVDLKVAQSATEEARLAEQQAKLAQMSLEVSDCVLRAPFDGEIATRSLDPGAFVRPGMPVVSIVDRTTARFTADAPESDFGVVAPGAHVRVRVYATNADVDGIVARRAPETDPTTRTVHFEIDVPDPERQIPANTTGEVFIPVGQPVAATEIPLRAASVRDKRASFFVVDDGAVHARMLDAKGELGGSLFVGTELPAGALVVVEGRSLLADGDRVSAKEKAP